MSAPEVSHGRGGAGNITADDTKYTDAEIVRTADEGTGVSTGRGGAANIISTNADAAGPRPDHEVVPEAAVRPSMEGDYHVGRGGAGNEHRVSEEKKPEKAPGSMTPTGLADKLKAKVLGVFKK